MTHEDIILIIKSTIVLFLTSYSLIFGVRGILTKKPMIFSGWFRPGYYIYGIKYDVLKDALTECCKETNIEFDDHGLCIKVSSRYIEYNAEDVPNRNDYRQFYVTTRRDNEVFKKVIDSLKKYFKNRDIKADTSGYYVHLFLGIIFMIGSICLFMGMLSK